MFHTTDAPNRSVSQLDPRRSASLIDGVECSRIDDDFSAGALSYDDPSTPIHGSSTDETRLRRARLVADLAPAGAFEIELVDRIVTTLLEIETIAEERRARIESGEITLQSKECAAICRYEAHLSKMFSKSMQDLRNLRRDRDKHANDRRRVSIQDIIKEHDAWSNQNPHAIDRSVPPASSREIDPIDSAAVCAIVACSALDSSESDTTSRLIAASGGSSATYEPLPRSLATESTGRSLRSPSDGRNDTSKTEIERRLIEHRQVVSCCLNYDPRGGDFANDRCRSRLAAEADRLEPDFDVRRASRAVWEKADRAAPT